MKAAKGMCGKEVKREVGEEEAVWWNEEVNNTVKSKHTCNLYR